ncbi:hypothetical protein [Rhizobium sophoriradicis]|uniref:Uncharacterized protein n=1 Tax=Rhizobium sophoriradicis TaxID=1535245 RepID=A0A2A5KKT9_9HYPH|nr:hypothetical protein [Rhizobium sophoriradicis]PCK77686.1 hypothetical protein CPT34_28745 [Rhizobium sophoriradicis]
MTDGSGTKPDQLRASLAQVALRRLADNPGADITDLVRRMDDLKKLGDALPPSLKKKFLMPMAVGAICLGVLGASLVIKVDAIGLKSSVVLNANASSMTFSPSSVWLQADPVKLSAGQLRIDNLIVSFSNPPKAFQGLTTSQWLEVQGGNLALQSLSLHKGSLATVDSSKSGETTLYGDGASGEILANGLSDLKWSRPSQEPATAALELVGEPPEIFSFATSGRGAPGRLAFVPSGPITFENISVTDLKFGREVQTAPAESRFVSTLASGTLRLPDIGKEFNLLSDRAISFVGLTGTIEKMTVDKKIELRFVGKAREIYVGSSDVRTNATPSLLVYLYRNQIVAFLFTAFTVIWGALWSLARLTFA